MEDKNPPLASSNARACAHALVDPGESPDNVLDYVPSSNLMQQAIMERQAMIQRLEAERVARQLQEISLHPGTYPRGLVANPYHPFSNSNYERKDPAVCDDLSQTVGLNYVSPYNYGSPYNFHVESSMRHRLVANPYHLFLNSNKKEKDPAVCDDMSQRTIELTYVSPYNYGSPYDFHGESSTGRPTYLSSCQGCHVGNHGFLENSYAFIPNSINVGNLDRERSPFIDYNHDSSYKLLQNHKQIPYSDTSILARNSSVGMNLTLPIERSPEISSQMILDLMTNEDGKFKFERLLLDYGFFINIIRVVTQDREIVAKAAKDGNGIESVKLLLEAVKASDEQCKRVTSALQQYVLELMMHPIAFELVSYCLVTLSYRQNSFLFDAVSKHCLKLARNENGITCLKECIFFSKDSDQEKILNKIICNSMSLAKNSRGNYVIQYVLELDCDRFNQAIYLALKDHLEELALDQHGSYVIQKCIESPGGETLVYKLLTFDQNKLERLVTDRYGNYVLQTALKLCKGTALHYELVCAISGLPKELEENVYARNVLRLIESSNQENFGFEGLRRYLSY